MRNVYTLFSKGCDDDEDDDDDDGNVLKPLNGTFDFFLHKNLKISCLHPLCRFLKLPIFTTSGAIGSIANMKDNNIC